MVFLCSLICLLFVFAAHASGLRFWRCDKGIRQFKCRCCLFFFLHGALVPNVGYFEEGSALFSIDARHQKPKVMLDLLKWLLVKYYYNLFHVLMRQLMYNYWTIFMPPINLSLSIIEFSRDFELKGIAQSLLKTRLVRQRRMYVEESGPLSRKLK